MLRTTTADLDRLWQSIPRGAALTVVMEPARNAWVPLAAWFRRRGAAVILVPPEQPADLRDGNGPKEETHNPQDQQAGKTESL